MTTSPVLYDDFPTLTGRQEPHHLSVFDGLTDRGDAAVLLASRVRKTQMPWQRDAMHAILSMSPDGLWTHPDCCIIVPRQNGKSLILVLRSLYGLFVLGERIIYTSQLWPTAEDAYKRLWSIIKSRPSLKKRVVKNTCSQGKGYIELDNGAKIVFCTRSNDSGRGFDEVDLVIYDEAYNLTEGEIAALSFTQMASQNAQTIYASSAVNQEQHPNGAVLAAVRSRGLAQEEGLYFAEWMAPESMPRDEESTWQYCNPSYGVIQKAPMIRKLMRGFSTPKGRKSFDVEALGRGDWPVEEVSVKWSLITESEWLELHDPAPELVGPVAIGIDRTMDRQWWVIAAAQRTSAGRIHVEIGYFRSGKTAAIVELVEKVMDAWDPCAVGTDGKSPAKTLELPLLDLGVELVKTTTNQIATSSDGLIDDAKAGVLSHSNQPVLNDSVEGAVKRDLPGGDWVPNKQGTAMVAPMLAVQIARWALLTFGSRAAGPAALPAFEKRVQDEISHSSVNAFDALTAAF
ncbi:phage terminase large subunit-like protein [Rhodococcus sp. 27YEA15]|uniref:hypothetical protein n=1 Tax=Rhodococcus sp. 27YEA15 TaxID=3156259 RepID=UPI003C7A1EEE